MAAASFDAFQRNQVSAFVSGTGIGTLAGLIGLGGAEFRLPILISMFRFGALEAVIINKAMSLVVVASALAFRTGTTSVEVIEVLQEDDPWVHLLVRHCELVSVKPGRLERQLPLLLNGTEIRRKRATIAWGKPERLQWSEESVRSILASRSIGLQKSNERSTLPPEPPAAPRPHVTPSAKGPGANGPSTI